MAAAVKVLPSEDVVFTKKEPSSPTHSVPDMEKQPEIQDQDLAKKSSAFKALGWLDRLLALWIFLAMAIGIILGNFVPNTGPTLQKGKFVGVSIPIGKRYLFSYEILTELMHLPAIGLLVMMYPILCKVKYETLHLVLAKKDIWTQIIFSIILNWIVAPLLMVNPFHVHHLLALC
jgi:ACR3 family arsenite transporter